MQSELNPNDPLVNTASEYMYQMATIAYHTLHSDADGRPRQGRHRGRRHGLQGRHVRLPIDGRYWTEFNRANPIEAAAREKVWTGTAHALIAELGVGSVTASALQIGLGLAGLFAGFGLRSSSRASAWSGRRARRRRRSRCCGRHRCPHSASRPRACRLAASRTARGFTGSRRSAIPATGRLGLDQACETRRVVEPWLISEQVPPPTLPGHSTTRSCRASTPTGARRTTCRSARSTCSTTRSCASRSARARQAAAARPLGHDPGPQLHLRPRQPRHQGARPRRDLHHRAGSRRAGHGRERLPRGNLHARCIRTSRRTRRHAAAVPAVLVSRAASAATSRRRRPARSTRAASWATRSRTPSARPSTTRTCRRSASSATARPRPGRSRRAGTRTSSSTRSTDGAVLPILHLNGYKIANPTDPRADPAATSCVACSGLRLHA